MKFCKDCKHFETMFGNPRCFHPSQRTTNPVYGTPHFPDCHLLRHESGACGPDGTLFEADEPAGPITEAIMKKERPAE